MTLWQYELVKFQSLQDLKHVQKQIAEAQAKAAAEAAARAADHFDDFALELFARLLRVYEDFDAVASERKPRAALANVDVVQTGTAHDVGGSARREFDGARGIRHLHFQAKSVAVGLNLVGAAQNLESAGDQAFAGPFVHTRFKRQVGGREFAPGALLKKSKQAGLLQILWQVSLILEDIPHL